MAASAADPAFEVESMLAKVALECGGDISASQEEILATSFFLGGDNGLAASASQEEEEEVFATPPDATQTQEEPVTMCTLPFTPTPSKSPAPPTAADDGALAPPSSKPRSPAPPCSKPRSPAPPSSDDDDDAPPVNRRTKPRVCPRKVRGARISTPTPSPEEQQPPRPEQQQQPQPEQQIHADPLVRAVLAMPSRTTTATTSSREQDPLEEFIVLTYEKGILKRRS